jgi:integrase
MSRKRNAQGAGSIRRRKDGRWEARYTVGRNPETGKQIQKSIYANSQKEVLKQLHQIQADILSGNYLEPSKMTLGIWMDIWLSEYKRDVKQTTKVSYSGNIKNHIKPELGSIPLQKLQAHHIQSFYNYLQHTGKSPQTIKNIHCALHGALERAVKLGYIRSNSSKVCTLPRTVKKEMQVIPNERMGEFLDRIKGDCFETLYHVVLFTGMRHGEIHGLTWDCVDFESGTILISKQLARERKPNGKYFLDTTKHDKVRKIKPAKLVMAKLQQRKTEQNADKLRAGAAWNNYWNLVFTDQTGGYLPQNRVRAHFKRIVKAMGMPDLRFHDMRHTYAMLSLMSGDDIKTLQENMGHHTAAFTLDVYGHVTDRMKEASAKRMDQFIKNMK